MGCTVSYMHYDPVGDTDVSMQHGNKESIMACCADRMVEHAF